MNNSSALIVSTRLRVSHHLNDRKPSGRFKLELIVRHSVFELSFGEAALEALRRDVRGFAGAPPAQA